MSNKQMWMIPIVTNSLLSVSSLGAMLYFRNPIWIGSFLISALYLIVSIKNYQLED